MTTLSPKTDRLAMLIGAKTGQTADEVVHDAVAAHAERVGITDQRPVKKIDMAKLREIQDRIASLPLLDRRTTREILDEAWSRE